MNVRGLCAVAVAVWLLAGAPVWAAELFGQVTFNRQPVPGATVTATRPSGGQDSDVIKKVTASDPSGVYRFPDLAEGVWTITVQMFGFTPVTREIKIPPDAPPPAVELALLPLAEITRGLTTQAVEPPVAAAATSRGGTTTSSSNGGNAPAAPAGRGAGPGPRGGFQRAAANPNAAPPPAAAAGNPFPNDNNDDRPDSNGAADGLLINGSVNNGAASPFAQARAFGNNRPGGRGLYNGGIGLLTSNSALDSRPFSFTGQPAVKPEYNDLHFTATFGGPIRIPRLMRRGPNFFGNYQHVQNHDATTQSTSMPTALERAGDFSQSRNVLGQPVQLIDPATGQPFPGNVIPADRISPQAAALLGYYPQPNISGSGNNYQAPILLTTKSDTGVTRLQHQFRGGREQFQGVLSYNRTTVESANLFSFVDTTQATTLNLDVNHSHRLNQFMFLRSRYTFTRATNDVTPNFANVANVSGLAGILGNDQSPVNWGPPSLSFTTIAGLSTGQYAANTNLANGGGTEIFWFRGRHSLTFGGNARRQAFDIFSQQNPRGSFGFTGGATGSDLADFMLGLPQTSSIAFGNPDKAFRQNILEAYVNDDYRVSPVLTLNIGVRWEYESPITEAQGRLVNLDLASGFTGSKAVVADDGLLKPDRAGIEPRVSMAWRPIPGSSLVVRASYGMYRNQSVYQSIATLLAQQPPLSTTATAQTSAALPLTLATGLLRLSATPLNTFAVDPAFRVGTAHNYQASVQRDLPSSLTVIATYLGSHGTHLMQEILPNTYPVGGVNPCASCPTGFVFLSSNGTSQRDAAQIQLRRRLRNGFTASGQYTLAKATDDATAFGGASLAGFSIAQNWLDLDAERGPSSFDQRHQFTAQGQYTTGAGITGGTLVDGIKGRLLKDWTFVAQFIVGSGLPVTPVYLVPVPGTGFVGSVRARLTGADTEAPDGYYLNPAAYGAPLAGQWGDAGRNSERGPSQFTLNAAIGRTFRWGPRFNIDWRIDANNVLNRMVFTGVNTIVGNPQFGQPNAINQPRKILSSLRVRF
ncbi:MAG TPA: carboxypeptidase regulatory-like domain-containing protein [Vicinamibacterales bacterium]|jgi:hypothetical protein|nr:carboxypeptidase regulatory-like domain-containing protein [Vicinamibacterales bacterium]